MKWLLFIYIYSQWPQVEVIEFNKKEDCLAAKEILHQRWEGFRLSFADCFKKGE